MVGRRSGLAVWVVACAVAAACGGQSSQGDEGSYATAGRGGGGGSLAESGRANGGGATNEGGFANRSGSGGGDAGGAGPGAAGEAGTAPAAGAGGANGGAASSETAGAGGVGGEPTVGVGDINADGCVDLRDWVILGRSYGCSVSGCGDPRADLVVDGWIDVIDYLVLTEHWYEGEGCRPFCQSAGESGAGGASSAELEPIDLSGDACIGWDDLDIIAESYGCDASCAAPNTDVVPDGCVDDRDLDVWQAAANEDDWCEGTSPPTANERRAPNSTRP